MVVPGVGRAVRSWACGRTGRDLGAGPGRISSEVLPPGGSGEREGEGTGGGLSPPPGARTRSASSPLSCVRNEPGMSPEWEPYSALSDRANGR